MFYGAVKQLYTDSVLNKVNKWRTEGERARGTGRLRRRLEQLPTRAGHKTAGRVARGRGNGQFLIMKREPIARGVS